ncbi:MAG: UDP-N-acetylmuramate--L-alanine ligase [Eggerthellaceae bacterium]|nr:UDP-N-acetylmuramate--L-alanine ligase [Eggerthellaceae bacterium]
MSDQHIDRVHFIGIGGVGMSGIALVAKAQGMQVSGSDLRASRYTEQLLASGISVGIGHDTSNIPSDPAPDVVVVSTAILDNNPELIAAREAGIPIWHRAQMLARLGLNKKTLACAGTHGKTTTSSMLASTLDGMGVDPTFLIGGIVRAYGTNAHSGSDAAGSYYVVEADESDKSFTYLNPYAVIVTNIEADHLDHYEGGIAEIEQKFAEFMALVDDEGLIVVCGEDDRLVELAKSSGKRLISYGEGDACDVRVLSWQPKGVGSTYTLALPDGSQIEGSILQNPGRHNVLNAAAALSLLWGLGEDVQAAAKVLSQFAGVRRRFDLVGEAQGVTIIDDYAHHPTEVAATIEAAKKLDFNQVHVLFQPHRYSRVGLFTEVLRNEFAHAFDAADTVTFMDVYSAGETPVPGISGQTFMDVVESTMTHPPLNYVAHRLDVVPYLAEIAGEGDLVITMGAGDVTSIGPELLAYLQGQTQ